MNQIIGLIKGAMNKGAHYIVAGSFLTKFVSFFGSIFLIRFLSKEDYGVLTYYENFYSYFLLFAGLGLAEGMLRYVILADRLSEKKGLYLYAIRRGECYNLILLAVCSCICIFYPHPAEFKGAYRIGLLLTLVVPFQFVLTLDLSTLRGLFDYKSYAVTAFVTSAVFVLFRVVGAKVAGLSGTVCFRLGAEIVCALLSTAYVYRKYFRSEETAVRKDLVKPFNTYSLQLMFTNGLWAIFMLNDVFLLGRISGNATVVAEYKTAYAIPANLALVSAAVGTFAAPFFTKKENEGDRAWVRSSLRRLRLLTFGLVLSTVIVCGLFTRQIIALLFGSRYLSVAPVFRVLLISSLINNGLRYPIANIYSSIGKQKLNLCVAAVGIGCQIVLDLILIPKYGAMGAAYGAVVVQAIMSAILIVYDHMIWKTDQSA